ncbi:MAG: tyrosine-protein kinase family protein [Candidatus Hodarchaeales archaeon]
MEIIAVHSFKGGSGKTFASLNMAVASARSNTKTIIMDCDFGSPSFQANLPPEKEPQYYGNDYLLGNCDELKIFSQTNIENLDAIYADPKPILGEGLLNSQKEIHWAALENYSKLRETLEKMRYKRFFLDTTPDLSYTSISALTIADTIILVHRPVIHTLNLSVYLFKTIYGALGKSLKHRNFFLLYNQVPHGSSELVERLLSSLTEKLQKYIDIQVLGQIKLDITMDLSPSLLLSPDSPVLEDINKMLKKI